MSSIKFSPLHVAALKSAEPSREAWEELVAWCYKTSSDGVSRVHEVTSHYLAMRNERDALMANGVSQSNPNTVTHVQIAKELANELGKALAKLAAQQTVIEAAVARHEAWTVWRERHDGATLAERNAFYDAGRKLDAAVAEYLKERR